MKVDKKLVSEISSVMKLAFSENEMDQLVGELNQTLDMLSALDEVNTEEIEASYYGGLGEAVFRKDVPMEKPEEVQAMLEQVRASKDRMIKVPAMLDDGEAGA